MDKVINWLTEKGSVFMAGDYKSFDRNFHPAFRAEAYALLGKLLVERGVIHQSEWDVLVRHETEAEAFLGVYGFKPRAMHFSGCFFTTIINIIVNEGYLRYVFGKLNPTLFYDDHARAKILGDDHVICVSKTSKFDGPSVVAEMAKIGQIYTSTTKTEAPTTTENIEEVTFLGAHPRLVDGRYSGAARDSTLLETPQWIRAGTDTLMETVISMMELASQWDEAKYNWYCNSLAERYKQRTGLDLKIGPYHAVRSVVAARTADSGARFTWHAQVGTVSGLTTLQGGESHAIQAGPSINQTSLAVQEQAYSYAYAASSLINRGDVTWATTDAQGTILASYDLPFGILSSGNTDNIQNMLFDHNLFFHGDVLITIQVNGSPFAQGNLCVFFYPLDTMSTVNLFQWTSNAHVMLNPGKSVTASIRVPYQFLRNVMNTNTIVNTPTESLGTLYIGVLNPLVNVDSKPITITVFSSYPDAFFSLPRPPVVAALMTKLQKQVKNGEISKEEMKQQWDKAMKERNLPVVKRGITIPTVAAQEGDWKAEGQGSSNTYNIGKIAGDLTSESRQTMNNDLSAEVPMDSPHLAGGGVPVFQQLPSMSKGVGVQACSALQLKQDALYMHGAQAFDPEQTTVDYVMSRLSFNRTATWSVSDAVGTELHAFEMNSFVGHAIGDYVSAAVGFWNLFEFWRGDIEITVQVIRTAYQSGRLRAVIGYGTDTILSGDESTYVNHVLDFTGDSDRQSFVIPFNAGTGWLRTFAGVGATDNVQNHSLGVVSIQVANVLNQINSAVSPSVEFNVYFRLLNPRFAVPKAVPFVIFDALAAPFTNDITSASPEEYQSQVGQDVPINVPAQQEQVGDALDDPSREAPNFATETKVPPQHQVCRLKPGEQFEYTVTDVHEVARRMVPIGFNALQIHTIYDRLGNTRYYVYIKNFLRTPMRYFYAAWSGSVIYRIYSNETRPFQVTFLPWQEEIDSFSYSVDSVVLPGWSSKGTIVPFDYTTTLTDQTSGYLTQLMKPNEISTAVSTNFNFSTVLAPFQTQFNYCTTQGTSSVPNAYFCGYLGYTQNLSSTTAVYPSDYVYQAAGDDFRFGIYRTPFSVQLGVVDFPFLVGKVFIGGYVFDNS